MIDWASDWEDQLLFRFFRACQFLEAWQIHTKSCNIGFNQENQEIQGFFVLHWISKSCMKIKSKWQIFWLSFFILFTEGFWHPKDLWNLEECNQKSGDNAEDWCYHAMMPTAPVSSWYMCNRHIIIDDGRNAAVDLGEHFWTHAPTIQACIAHENVDLPKRSLPELTTETLSKQEHIVLERFARLNLDPGRGD